MLGWCDDALSPYSVLAERGVAVPIRPRALCASHAQSPLPSSPQEALCGCWVQEAGSWVVCLMTDRRRKTKALWFLFFPQLYQVQCVPSKSVDFTYILRRSSEPHSLFSLVQGTSSFGFSWCTRTAYQFYHNVGKLKFHTLCARVDCVGTVPGLGVRRRCHGGESDAEP